MSHLSRLCLLLVLAAVVPGCQAGLPGSGPGQAGDVTANAVAGDPIEVTALEDPAPAVAAAPGPEETAPPEGAVDAAAAPVPDGSEGAPAAAEGTEALPTETDPALAEPPEVALPEAVEVAPGEAKSEAQLQCERKKGRWSVVGDGPLQTCIFYTRDAGKQCDAESDCEEACLARSRTCSPIKPLLGCNEILQDNGARVTQCVE